MDTRRKQIPLTSEQREYITMLLSETEFMESLHGMDTTMFKTILRNGYYSERKIKYINLYIKREWLNYLKANQ